MFGSDNQNGSDKIMLSFSIFQNLHLELCCLALHSQVPNFNTMIEVSREMTGLNGNDAGLAPWPSAIKVSLSPRFEKYSSRHQQSNLVSNQTFLHHQSRDN